MAFALHIQSDCDARNFDVDDFFHLLGHKTKGNALRTLTTTIPQAEMIVVKSDKNSVVRPRDVYMISVNQFEEVMRTANTDAGKKWRKSVLKIKNVVVQYMKMEMKEQMSKLAIEEARRVESDAKRSELEGVQTRLQATMEAERSRQVKKNARKVEFTRGDIDPDFKAGHSSAKFLTQR